MIKKSDFNAGNPYSCWLREEILGELAEYKRGEKNLISKHKIKVTDGLSEYVLREVKRFDDYPPPLQKVAKDIIRRELGETLE